jgi:hypothetical protein
MPFQNDLSIKLNHLETRIKTFDLEKMDFEVPKIKIKGLNQYKQSITANKKMRDNSTPQTRYKLQLGIDLSKIAVDYQDEVSIKLHFYLKGRLNLTILILQPFFLIDVLNVSDANGKVAFVNQKNNDQKESAVVLPGTGILKAESISNALILIMMIIYLRYQRL